MPGYAWGIPATLCKTGARLRKVKNSPCARCYALKGRFVMPNVKEAYQRRYDGWLADDFWVDRMVQMIAEHTTFAVPYFRWFDSGDLQDLTMLGQIIDIAQALPAISFWLPTQERGLIRAASPLATAAPNLCVRVSTPEINGPRPQGFPCASTVLPKSYNVRWAERVARSTPARHYCPAPLQDNECGKCRACWDPEVAMTVYLEH